ncbi:carbohydrate-binding protein [Saccharicrinis aurantiacus]|uniref:carbohydrate-binding protein n=1 Tax=Saccharicrinis aurantiacus TaxID=1849719 RepID=UPI00094F73D4|nr:carbohydrate-binding protein [Saccharicrinis aurantiacus]
MKKNKKTLLKKGHILLLSLLLLCLNANIKAQYIHTNGTKIVDANENDIYFNGMNLGNWLLWEGYLMMGDFNYRTHTQFLNNLSTAFGNDMDKAKEFEHQWRMNYVTEQAIADLSSLGFNSVRVPFHYNLFWDGTTVKNDGFQYFDRLIQYCKKYNIYILLDMHAAPGYQNPGDHADNINSNASQPRETVKFWDDDNVQIASKVWKHIASYYSDEPIIWGYDLINEPVPQPGREFELLASMVSMRNAIREVDNNHVIVAEGSWWGSDMAKLDWNNTQVQSTSGISTRWDDNMVYQTHHYSTDVSQLDSRLSLCNSLNVPLILGEYGESDMHNLRNMTDWCVNNNVDYFPWSFKKMSHDKCLWTIEPNSAYEELKNAINSNSEGPADLYNNMIDFCNNNIANGSHGLIWDQSFYDAVKPSTPPCTIDVPSTFTASDISATSISLTWKDASDEDGYIITCSNGENVELEQDITTYTFSNLSESTNYTFTLVSFNSDCTSSDVTTNAKTICSGNQSPYLGSPAQIPGLIEGENFDIGCSAYYELSDHNHGIDYRDENVDITEGYNGSYAIGWIESGEWLEYTVNVQSTNTYKIEYTVASPEETGEIQLQINENTITTMDIPNTGAWDAWETKSKTINLNAGIQVIRLVFNGALNFDKLNISKDQPPYLNSLTIEPLESTIYLGESIQLEAKGYDQNGNEIAVSEIWELANGNISSDGLFVGEEIGTYTIKASVEDIYANCIITVVEKPTDQGSILIEAEDYFEMSGIQTENTSDIGGGLNVGWIDNSDWMGYHVNIPSKGIYTIEYRVASENGGAEFQLEEFGGGTVFGTISVPKTGNWQSWTSVSHDVTLNAGNLELAIAVTKSGFNFNWMKIIPSGLKNGAISTSAQIIEHPNFEIYPNPATDRINIKGLSEVTQLEVYNLTGNKVAQHFGNSIDLSSLQNGIYILRFTYNGEAYLFKFIKK